MTVKIRPLYVWFGIFVFSGTNFASAAKTIGWRESGESALNCTYVFLASHDKNISYAALRQQCEPAGRKISLLDIKKIIQSHDINVEVIRCAPNESLFERTPAIILLQDAHGPESYYGLLLSNSPNSVFIMEGTGASVIRLRRDDFQRLWSGTAIVSISTQSSAIWRRVFIGTLALLFPYIYFRLRSKSQKCNDTT